jgi:methylenetetrahydrofolate dehydrogenase (NADP+)/methenyltetrahydrofolate cyclohydrolase/formyltetrahydrofolate synthetase
MTNYILGIAFQMATLISGKDHSAKIRKTLKEEIQQIRSAKWPYFSPGLVVVQVGDLSNSNVYIKHKLKAAEEIGINAKHVKLPR